MNFPGKKLFDFDAYKPAPVKEAPALADSFDGIESTADLRIELSRSGLSGKGLSEDDCVSILQHAAKLMANQPEMSQDLAISEAYIDRLATIGTAGIALFKSIPVATLRDIFEQRFARPISEEAIDSFIRRFESGRASVGESTALAEWIKELQTVPTGENTSLNYVVANEGRVTAFTHDNDIASLQAKAIEENKEGGLRPQ